ncbi:MAG: S26 family signal peptidase [Bacteroidales bacterium]|jgi:signal peptidase I|nr:S26 family signal peptidase [Bacteroidales bacterium]
MRKKTIFIILLIILLLSIFLTFNRYVITKITNFQEQEETVLVEKIKNENTLFNFIKQNPEKCLQTNNLVLYKNPLLFDDDFSDKPNILGRIIARPGEKFEIINSQVFLNDSLLIPNYDLFFLYILTMSDSTDFNELLKDKVLKIEKIINNFSCQFIANQRQADELLKTDKIVNIRKLIIDDRYFSYDVFPGDTKNSRNKDQYKYVIIPKKSTTVSLSVNNINLYKNIIDVYEDNELLFDHSKIEINGQKADKYTFKQNYYFVLSDNRYEINDSRRYGFIPENQILGKVKE